MAQLVEHIVHIYGALRLAHPADEAARRNGFESKDSNRRKNSIWSHGSVGRAYRSHRWGHRFESCCDHQKTLEKASFFVSRKEHIVHIDGALRLAHPADEAARRNGGESCCDHQKTPKGVFLLRQQDSNQKKTRYDRLFCPYSISNHRWGEYCPGSHLALQIQPCAL